MISLETGTVLVSYMAEREIQVAARKVLQKKKE